MKIAVRVRAARAVRLAITMTGLGIACLLIGSASARADTILWANDARGPTGPLIDEWDVDEAAGTGTLVQSFTVPDPTAQGQPGGGIAVVGSNIYYSVGNSGSVFLTNTSGGNLGIAFNTGLPGISSIASDGQFLYLAATGDKTLTENVYKFSFGGVLLSTLTLVPQGAAGAPPPFTLGRTGLEIVGTDFVANQGNNEGSYNKFDSNGNLIPPVTFLQGTQDFGYSGVAFDGTFYYVANVEDVPSIFRVFNASGALIKDITLTGCPGPNQLCDFQDLSVVIAAAVPEPTTLALLGTAMFGFGIIRRRKVAPIHQRFLARK
jgi:PEP-CTERM motif